MKAIVMGAGVIGVTSAWYLARDGHEVVVIDRGPEPACEASYANAGLIVPGHAFAWGSPGAPLKLIGSLLRKDRALRLRPRFDPHLWAWMLSFLRQCTPERAHVNTLNKLRLCLYSLGQLQELVRETGVSYEGRSKGSLYLYRSSAELEAGVKRYRILREQGLILEVADARRVVELEPALESARDRIAGAVHCPRDQSGDACLFTRELAERCEAELGVRFHFDTRIERLEADRGRVVRVVTDQGGFTGDVYVLSLGCESVAIGRPIGVRLPIYPVKGYSVTLPIGRTNRAPTLGGMDEEHLVAWSRLGERLRVASIAEFSGYDRSHRPEDFRAMLQVMRDLFPEGADYDSPDYWAGLRPMTPTSAPLFGKAKYPNLFLNTGHGHLGWTMCCGSARVTADLVARREPEISLQGMTYQG